MIFGRMFSRRWLLSTFLVIAAIAVMIRLGIWQLDRLDQRRSFNSRVLAQIDQPPLTLEGEALALNLEEMEYRQVFVTGEYVQANEIALRNQYWENQWGVHLITPLKISGSNQVVFIDRGWIPADTYETGQWSQYAENGRIEVRGIIRQAQSKADYGKRSDPTPEPGQALSKAWNFINLPLIAKQLPYPILPVYIQQAPDPTWDKLPYRTQPELELTEGPHLGYAIQWFVFASILGIGYPFFMQRQERRSENKNFSSDDLSGID